MTRLDSASAELAAVEARQAAVNQAIDGKLNSMSLAEQQQHMMTFMMEHPEQAQE
jgi:hypothetical protein